MMHRMAGALEQAPSPLPLESIQRFARALRDAVHDKKLEASTSLVFLYDADVVIKTIQGLTFDGAAMVAPGDHRAAVHALLSAGFLGPVRMLRPHLLEFDRAVHSWPDIYSFVDRGLRQAHREYLIKLWGLDQYQVRLAKLIADAPHGHREGSADGTIGDMIREDGFELFVKLELCYGGSWQQRLHRLRRAGLLRLEPLHAADTIARGDETARKLLAELSSYPGRPSATVNNVVDAGALAALVALSRALDSQRVRFYTETNAVRHVFGQGAGAGLLRDQREPDGTSLLRDEDYFLLRCCLPALAFPQLDLSDGALCDWDMQRLEEADSQLYALLKDGDESDVRAALDAIGVKGMTLKDVVAQFAQLGFLEAVLLRQQARNGWKELLPSLYDVFQAPILLEAARAEVRTTVLQVSSDLREQVGRLRGLHDALHTVLKAISRRRQQMGRGSQVPRLALELGLGRWGLHAQLADPERIEGVMQAVLQGDERDAEVAWDAAVMGFSPPVHREELEFGAVLFWFLGLDRPVGLLCTPDHVGEWPSRTGLLVLGMVARLRLEVAESGTTSPMRLDRVVGLVAEGDALIDATPAADLPAALMGGAYLRYLAWRAVSDRSRRALAARGADGTPSQDAALARQWAADSLTLADRARKGLDPEAVAWAFATNHCAYVALVAQLGDDVVDRLYEELEGIEERHHHYRFADTHARRFSVAAERLMGRGDQRLSGPAWARRDEICRLLRSAERILSSAQPFFGDPEVTEHLRQVEQRQLSLRCWEVTGG